MKTRQIRRAGRPLAGLLRRLARNERGQDLVELTIVAPLLLLIVFAIIEFGGMLDSQQAMSYLTREGANIASRGEDLDNVLNVTMQNGSEIGLDSRGGAVVSRVVVENSVAKIDEQVASSGYASASRVGNAGDIVASMAQVNLVDGSRLHVVEVFYQRPSVTPLMGFFSGSIPDVMYDKSVF